jgi:trehalose/maltose hydrolase-like predicted phosphorylase
VQNLFLVTDAARRISRLRRGEHDDPVLCSDVDAVRGGTTKEGIRVGVMAGTLDILQRYYAGARIGDEVLYFDPRLPGGLGGLSFPMQFRETPILVTLIGGPADAGRSSRGCEPPDTGRHARRHP